MADLRVLVVDDEPLARKGLIAMLAREAGEARFGREATKFVNSPAGRELNLRGINARVVQPGIIRTGDIVKKRLHGDKSQG